MIMVNKALTRLPELGASHWMKMGQRPEFDCDLPKGRRAGWILRQCRANEDGDNRRRHRSGDESDVDRGARRCLEGPKFLEHDVARMAQLTYVSFYLYHNDAKAIVRHCGFSILLTSQSV